MQQTILEVKNLTTSFKTERGVMKAIDGINFRVNANEILGIVGESGCGKSVTCQSIMRLYDEKYTVILRGEILFKGENLLKYSGRKMQSIRGDEISMVFQDALSALNPVMRVGDQIMEAIKLHNKGISKQEARERALNILKLVGIPAYTHTDEWTHSGFTKGSRHTLHSGLGLQCDFTPSWQSPYMAAHTEDGLYLADAALREQIRAIAPGCWARIQARQEFMRKELGIQLPDEVLPLSDLQGVCFPYLADLNVVLACR